jgi:hypothetical protein
MRVFGCIRLDARTGSREKNLSSTTRFLVFFVLRILLRHQRVKFLLLFWSQQGANSGARFRSWFFKAWP